MIKNKLTGNIVENNSIKIIDDNLEFEMLSQGNTAEVPNSTNIQTIVNSINESSDFGDWNLFEILESFPSTPIDVSFISAKPPC